MSSLSVVVPATDHPPTLPRCLQAIDGAFEGPEQVIVVDRPTQLSAAGARNHGAMRAHGDIVVFVDADVEVHPDAFAQIREAFAADDDLTAVFGSYDDTPADPGTVSRFRNLLHHHVHQLGGGPAETFWTGLGAVRRRAFASSGGFDEGRYPHPSIEDVELGQRLVAAGGTIRLQPSIQGTHLKAWSLRSMVHTDLFRRAVPWIALQVRTGKLSNTLNCSWRHRASALAVAALLVALAARSAPVAGALFVALVALNFDFYRLLVRRLGPPRAAVGIALHGVHHLLALVAIPWGVASGIAGQVRAPHQRDPRPLQASETVAE